MLCVFVLRLLVILIWEFEMSWMIIFVYIDGFVCGVVVFGIGGGGDLYIGVFFVC